MRSSLVPPTRGRFLTMLTRIVAGSVAGSILLGEMFHHLPEHLPDANEGTKANSAPRVTIGAGALPGRETHFVNNKGELTTWLNDKGEIITWFANGRPSDLDGLEVPTVSS